MKRKKKGENDRNNLTLGWKKISLSKSDINFLRMCHNIGVVEKIIKNN